MGAEVFLVEAIKQGGVLAVAIILVYFYRRDALDRVKDSVETATKEREDKLLLVKVLQDNTEALTRLVTLIERLNSGEREKARG